LIRKKLKLASREHTDGEVMHVGSLQVEIAKHCVGFPPANELNQEGVNVGTEERHRATRKKCMGRNIAGVQSQLRHVMAQKAKHSSEAVTPDLCCFAVPKVNRMERSGQRRVVLAKVADSLEDSQNRGYKDLITQRVTLPYVLPCVL
jgi:hypothetical protein